MGSSDITPVTPVEVIHRLSKLESRSDDHSDAINAIATRLATGDEILKTMAASVEAMRGDIRWVAKKVLLAVIGAIVALVIKDGVKELNVKDAAASPQPTAPSSSPSRGP